MSLDKVREQGRFQEQFIAQTLKAIPGMRDYEVAAKQFVSNLQMLEAGGWSKYLTLCDELRRSPSPSEERSAANQIAELKGFGPKQSRNFLQALGLTRHEIPLDSRVMKWLRDELKFPLPINSAVLANKEYYELVLDTVQKICVEAGQYPCMLDAAIFAISDDDSWELGAMEF